MPEKSDLFDYEPLRRPRRTNAVEQDPFTSEATATEFEAKFVGTAEFKKNSRGNSPRQMSEQVGQAIEARDSESSSEKWVLKRGHAFSFAGLFIFTFLVFFRPYELSPSLMWLSRGALVTAIVTLLVFIPTQLGLENRITIRTREVNLILILSLLCLISVPFALDKLQAWNGFVEYAKVVLMFVVMVNVVRTKTRLKALLLLVLVATAILSVAAINDYRVGNLALRGQRIAGVIGNLFDNPNDLALHLVTFLPIVVCLALGSRNPVTKIFFLAVALVVLCGMVVTFSRGGFIGLIFVVGTLVWRLGRRNRALVGITGALLISLFLVLAPAVYRERLATTGDESSQSRIGELKRSIFLAVRHPIFGVGMDNFVLYSDKEHATHNAYTQVASEVGLPAAAVYVLFLIAAIKRVRRIAAQRVVDKQKRPLTYLAVGLEASLIGYAVMSFFASVAYLWYVYYLVGYSLSLHRIIEFQRENR